MASRGRWARTCSRRLVLCLPLVVAGLLTVRPGLAQSTSGSWSTIAPMPTGRTFLAAATVPNGRIYAIGGSNSSSLLNSVEAYDPATNTWDCSVGDPSSGCSSATIAPMPTARAWLAVATGANGRIYAIGGGTVGAAFSTMEAYDPATNTWSTLAPMPTPRFGLAAASGPDGRIYAVGGRNPSTVFNTVEAYDPATNTWACSAGDTSPGCSSTTLAPMPTARAFLAAAAGPDGRIYAIGGDNASSLDTVEAYDPATNTWSRMAPMPTPRGELAAATGADGRIYAIGGASLIGGVIGASLNTVEAYDPVSNSWNAVAPLLTPRTDPAAATGRDGRIYTLGGYNSGSLLNLNTVEVYTPQTASPISSPPFTPVPVPSATPMPTPGVVTVVSAASGTGPASFTVRFSSRLPGQGEVYFGSGPGCVGLVEVATRDLYPGATQHAVEVTGNDLPGTVGDNGIIPGVTYWFEVVTVTGSGMEVDNNAGRCYSVTIPT